jgi:hypothetical protein
MVYFLGIKFSDSNLEARIGDICDLNVSVWSSCNQGEGLDTKRCYQRSDMYSICIHGLKM